jgi:broad specificity phosphatase PhoE
MEFHYKNKYLKYKNKYLQNKNISNISNISNIDNQTTNIIGGSTGSNSKVKVKVNKVIKIIFIRHGESTENIASKLGEAYDANNIVLTDKGISQAIKTGKYLSKMFGNKFACVYSSPKTRCVQTSNLIMEQIIESTEKIIIDDDIVEIGGNVHPFDGLSKNDRDKIIAKSSEKLKQVQKKLAKSIDPFERYELAIQFDKLINIEYQIKPNIYESQTNLINFFDKLRTQIKTSNYNHKTNILVVTHGGILQLVQKILSNIHVENTIFLSTKPFNSTSELLGNCACLYVGYDTFNDKFILVSPANTYHLD